MWTRKEVKDRAKEALRRSYWKIVLVSLLTILLGSSSGNFTVDFSNGFWDGFVNGDSQQQENTIEATLGSVTASINVEELTWADKLENLLDSISPVVLAVYLVTFCIIFVIILLIALAVRIFLIQPLLVGVDRFMLKSVDDAATLGEVGYTFEHNYKNGVKVIFFKELYVFLWSLLFVIPGIYKSYQYHMVSYILAEYPDIPYQEALKRSRDMMEGHKWSAFVLDLSFIGWHMLALVTCGISEIFYVTPYANLTNAALYRRLSDYGVQDSDC